MVRTGVYGYLKYGVESSFQGDASKTRVFGIEQKINGLQLMVNRLNLAQLNSQELSTFAFGRNEGKMSVDFILSNPWWLDGVLSSTTKSGSSPYTWYWYSNPAATNQSNKVINSLAMDIGFQGESASGGTNFDLTRTPLGALITQVAIKTSLNDTVKCTADLVWGLEKGNTGNVWSGLGTDAYSGATSQTDDINFPYTFVHGSLQTSEGRGSRTTIAQIQDVDLTLNTNAELLWGIGSANAVSGYRKLMEITGRINCAILDTDRFLDVANRAVTTDLVLTFNNGLTSTSQRQIQFTISNVAFADHTTNITPNDPVFQEVNFQGTSCTVAAINNSSSEP